MQKKVNGVILKKGRLLLILSIVLLLLLLAIGSASGHDQHGPGTGHLLGNGAFGNIELLSVEELTDTPELVADVAVNPAGTYAFLAHWGHANCSGQVDNREGGAWVVDIQDLENPEVKGFIPAHQDSRPGEGMQVVNITTKHFNGDMLVMNNEHCGKNGKGGVSLWDVTNPLNPRKLSEHFGDRGRISPGDANDIHSSFAWDTGDKAYVIIVDNFEFTDVDILDITNPKRPRLIREMNLGDELPEITQGPPLTEVFLHDMVVKQINGNWIMLLSYWDGGYVQLNVNDPANPTFIGDTDFTTPDPQLLEATDAELTPEGNGHQNEFTSDNQFFIGTDEDFAPYRPGDFQITTGSFAGAYPAVIVPGAAAPAILDDLTLNGRVVYGGYGCPDSDPIPSPEDVPDYLPVGDDEEKIIVLQRGPDGDPSATEAACFPGEKAHEAVLAGWDAVLFVQRHGGVENPPFCGSGAFVDVIVGVCTNHEAYHKLFGQEPSFTYPDGPAIGAIGEEINVGSVFDGWGYVHLFSNTLSGGKFAELDTYAIPEAHDEDFAVGYGDLTVHEVATHPTVADRAYLSYYAGGLRALKIENNELVETGGYLDPNGNNFWGVEVFVRDGQTIILGSDRDSGLWIFRDTEN